MQNIKRITLYLLLFLISTSTFAQQQVEGITYDSYNNAKNTYNYTYWNSNWKTNGVTTRLFSDQTSSYNLSINYTKLSINSLNVNTKGTTLSEAFQESAGTTFSKKQPGDIDVKILQNGEVLHELNKSNPTRQGSKIGQMADYGTWCNRRVVDSLVFTNNANVYGTFTGVEFTNWHNRFRITFQLKPRTTISNGQMQLSVQMPEAFDTIFYSNSIFGFASSPYGEGFAVKGGVTADSAMVCANTITVFTKEQNLEADTQYEVSLIFYAVKENFCNAFVGAVDDAEELTITATQTKPDNTSNVAVSYSNDEGMYYIDVPSYNMGYNNGNNIDLMQNINIEIENKLSTNKRVRLCFYDNTHKNIVGFSSMLRNPNGDPSGIPLQITKNWHNGTPMLYSANPSAFSKEYTELIIPANTTLKFDYTRVGALWGKVFGAFSHQLCVVGAGVPRGGWLEAGLGAFGENITHSPDYEYGNANVCDYRPFLCTNQYYGGATKEYGWTGNLGGMDLFHYERANGVRDYQSQVKTQFKKYGPNLTETSISTYSADNKLKMDYTFQLNRSDDFLRVYYKIKVKALADASFSRFDIFQLGHDTYRCFRARSVAYGNAEGVVGEFTPATGKEGYTTEPIALSGDDAWLWAGDGVRVKTGSAYENLNIDGNNSFIIRSYNGTFNGVENDTPYFRERITSKSNQYPNSYCIVPPPGVTSFSKGDSIELILEVCLMPKVDQVYYGPNKNFEKALTKFGNEWKMLYREVVGNKINATSETNELNLNYPLTVKTVNNTATLTVNGGVGYIPIVFSNLTSIDDPKLYLVTDTSEVLIDQSNYGKDFWQAEYNTETGLYELIFNVNHDTEGDTLGTFKYRLEVAPSAGPNSANDDTTIPESDISPTHYLNTTLVCYPAVTAASTNIAPLGTASQSTTAYDGEASRAIDGNTSGQWGDKSVTHTDNEDGAWWQVDLGSEKGIGEIKIYNRTDCCGDRLSNFTVYVINSEGETTFSQSFVSYPNPMLSIDANGAKGSVVKVQFDGTGTMSLAEVQVYSLPCNVEMNVIDIDSKKSLSDVLLYVNNNFFATNDHGYVATVLPKDEFDFTLSKKGYLTVQQSLDVSNDTSLVLAMKAAGKFNLNVQITDAETKESLSMVQVTIGDSVYSTNEQGLVSALFWEGEYNLALEKNGYENVACKLNLVTDSLISISMTKKKYLLSFEVNDLVSSAIVSDVSISINNTVLTTDAQGKASAELTMGEYDYSLSKAGYDSQENTITITEDKTISILLAPKSSNIENFQLLGVTIYPNPVNDRLAVVNDGGGKINLRLYNMMGADLTKQITIKGNNSKQIVDFTKIPAGSYVLTVKDVSAKINVIKKK